MFDKAKWARDDRIKKKMNGFYNTPEFKAKKKEWDSKSYFNNKEKRAEYNRKRYFEKKQDIVWYTKELERKKIARKIYHNEKGRESALRRKLKIIEYYGPDCKCCGISDQEFLAVDHINGGGNEHRRKMGIKGGRHFYDWLFKNDFPEGFQILCHNCNFAKDHYAQGCPHSRKSD